VANEIKLDGYFPGATLYAVIENAAGLLWRTDTSVFEAYNSANWASYALLLTEQSGSGRYRANFPPAIAAGKYNITAYARSGVSAALTDIVVGVGGSIEWDGTQEVLVQSRHASGAAVASVAGAVGSVTGSVGSVVGGVGGSVASVAAAVSVAPASVTAIQTDILAAVDGIEIPDPDLSGLATTEQAAAILAKVQPIGLGTITVTSPILEDGRGITIVQGDDYTEAFGRALEWDLEGLTIDGLKASGQDYDIHLIITKVSKLNVLTTATETDDGIHVVAELTTAQTSTITADTNYYLQARIAGSDTDIRLATGAIWLKKSVGAIPTPIN
jgi:hypothetical protein